MFIPSERRLHIAVGIGACGLILALALGLPYPELAGALAFAPLAILITIRFPFALALAFVLFSFFRLQEAFPVLMPLRIPQLLAVGTLLSLAVNAALGRLKPFWSRELTLFMLFFFCVLLSVTFATNREVAWESFSGNFIKIALMVPAIAWLASGSARFRAAGRGIIWAGVAVALVALYNRINGIELVEGTRVTIGRSIGSSLGDPNDLSLVLMFPASFALAPLMAPGHSRRQLILCLIVFAIILSAVIATQSRGGLLGILSVIGVYAYQRIRQKWLLPVLGTLALVFLFAVAGISDRSSGGAAETAEKGLDTSAQGRLYAWQAATRMAIAHPLTGVGLQCFRYNYFEYSDFWDGHTYVPHSTWFGVLGEAGFLGLTVFIIMVVSVIRRSITTVRALEPPSGQAPPADLAPYIMAQALLGGIVGFCVSGTFLMQCFTWPVYIILALTVALDHFVRERGMSSTPAQGGRHVQP